MYYFTDLPNSLPLISSTCGLSLPADDFLEGHLDLNAYLIHHPAATYYVRVKGESMINAGIHDGDLLVVDRSVEPRDNKVVIVRVTTLTIYASQNTSSLSLTFLTLALKYL